MKINITSRDILWSYVAQMLNIGMGVITLPLILKTLSQDEVGLYYIFASIISIISLFDLGFSSQFSRYLTYIFSGAQSLCKEGIPKERSEEVNEELLAATIVTAKKIYSTLSIVATLCLLAVGTPYLWMVTESGTLVENVPYVWIVFCISCFFNIYYIYLTAFLQGKGLVKEGKQAAVFSKLTQLLLLFILLYFFDMGLLGVVTANLIAPFVLRFLSYKHFYTTDVKNALKGHKVGKDEVNRIFGILFYNAKKIGLITILASSLSYASTVIIGAYLPLSVVASYGVMVQIVGIILGLSTTQVYSKIPLFGNLMVYKETERLKSEFGMSIFSFYVINGLGVLTIMCAPFVFKLCNFSVQLPAIGIVLLYVFVQIAEKNQSLFCQLLLVENNLVYYKSGIFTCIAVFVLLLIFLHAGGGIVSVIMAQAIPLFAYCVWKWPLFVMKKYEISFKHDILYSPIHRIMEKLRYKVDA